MKQPRKMKMPDGRLVAPSPDALALFLATHQPVLYATPPPAPPRGTDRPPSREHDYSTESFDIRKLAGREIMVIGLGSVGSHALYSLGAARLAINVIDPGIVQSRHATGGRTSYDLTQVGLRKVHALKEKMERDFPGTVINPLPYNTAEIPDSEMKSMLARSVVAVLALDDPDQLMRISDLAYSITELVQPAMHTKGESGHIAICAPFVTPCLRCILGINDAADIHRLDSEPASGLDIAAVAQLASRITVDLLYSKVTGQPISRWDTAMSLIYLSNTKDELSPDGPGIRFEGSRKRPGCPVCNNHTAA